MVEIKIEIESLIHCIDLYDNDSILCTIDNKIMQKKSIRIFTVGY